MASSFTQPFARGGDLIRSTLGSITWSPALAVSKAAVTALFSRIECGTLVIVDETSGRTTNYGHKLAREHSNMTNGVKGTSKRPGKVELVVHKESFWVRLFLFADMGFAEAYMLGEIQCVDLTGFFQVFLSSEVVALLMKIAFHLESRPTIGCNNPHLLCCRHDYRPCSEHEHPFELPAERVGAL